MDNVFEKLLSLCVETGRLYEPEMIFIGGMAVYLHTVNKDQSAQFAEATKDADVYISLSGFSDLRDIEELSQNARLSKHEFRKNGFSFDVYTERQSSLPVPYADVAAHAHTFDGVRVAAPEHLLVLKLEAAVNRHGSEHGRKDAKDVIRLLLVAGGALDASLSVKFMQEAHLAHLHLILKGVEFISLAKGNAQLAKRLRQTCQGTVDRIDEAFSGGIGDALETKEGAPKPVLAGVHCGTITKIVGDLLGQKTGRDPDILTWHARANLKGLNLKVQDNVEIEYAHGVGTVKVLGVEVSGKSVGR